jgi:hypothetical protein
MPFGSVNENGQMPTLSFPSLVQDNTIATRRGIAESGVGLH